MRDPVSTQMGSYLFRLRGRATIELFTKDTGISRATWSRIERGYAPTVMTLIKIHDVWGCPWEDLIAHYRQDFMPPEDEEPCDGAA